MIEGLLLCYSLVLARSASFVMVLPIFGGSATPRLVKLGLALALTVFWSGACPAPPGSGWYDLSAPGTWLTYLLAVGREVLLGAVLGYALGLFLVPARIAGEFIGQEMGLALGSQTDPTADHSATVMGQTFEMLGTLIFLGLDGHHVFLAVLHGTFARWPVAGSMPALPVAELVSGAAAAQEWGLLLAAPVGLCLFLTTVVLALMARAVPQLNIMSFGFALRLGVGLVAVLLLLPNLGAALISIFGRMGEFLYRLM